MRSPFSGNVGQVLKFLYGVNPRATRQPTPLPHIAFLRSGMKEGLAAPAAAFGTSYVSDFFPIMPRYFFHITHERFEIDQEGEELPDKHAAWKEATVTAGQTHSGHLVA